MTDTLTPEQRSYCMSKIRGKWTKQEVKIHNWLRGHKIRHKMHPKMKGKPDILLKDSKTVVFLDGCFWHKCPKCFQEPTSNRDFWRRKIEGNVKKDMEITKKLQKEGWDVVRIWEHEIRDDPSKCLKKIETAIK